MEKFKVNDKFVNMVNQFSASTSTMAFKIGFIRFLKNYPKLKKIFGFSSLFEE